MAVVAHPHNIPIMVPPGPIPVPIALNYGQPYNYGVFPPVNYNIIERLGEGTFGTVYKVQATNGNVYAMKKSKWAIPADNKAMTEVNALLSLNGHPNIVSMYNFFWDPIDFRLCIVMDFCNGGNLEEFIVRNRPPFQNTIVLMVQMANAVQYLHLKGIVHRDLKPENVLLVINNNNNVTVKVADFGIAKIGFPILPGQAPIGVIGTINGTPSYMAPEQFDGICTKKIDIFALGIIFCAILERIILNNKLVIFYSLNFQTPIGQVLRTNPGAPRIINPCLQIDPYIRNMINQMISPSAMFRPDADYVFSVLMSRLLNQFSLVFQFIA